MKIGKYISELLFENDFVILPQLGEFSTKYIPAKFIPELKKVESPSKVITFNENNKSGGGLLTEYIAKKEGMTSQQAKEFVNKFVSEMTQSLRSGKKVELESIGVFSMDQSGRIEFDADKSVNYLNDSMGMTSVNEPSKKSEAEAKSDLDKVLEDISPDVAPKKADPTIPVPPPTKKDIPAESSFTADAKKQESQKPAETVPGQRPVVTPVRPVQEPVSQKLVTPSRHETHDKPSKAGLPPAVKWVALTVVPLLIIIIVLALNFDYLFGDKSVIWNKSEPIEQTTTQEAEPVVEEPQETDAVAEEAAAAEAAPTAPEAGRPVYYIIVGSFEEEHSALILAEELRSKGASKADIFPVNRLGFYRVYYGYYYDLKEAENDLSKAKEVNSDAWILHR